MTRDTIGPEQGRIEGDDEEAPSSHSRRSSTPDRDPKRSVARLLTDVGETTTFDAALDLLLRSVCEFTGFTLAQAWTRRMRDAVLECAPIWYATCSGFEAFRFATVARAFERGGGLPGLTWESARCHWIEDLSDCAPFRRRAEARSAGLVSALFVPVIASGDTVAVIELFSTTPRAEDPAVVDILIQFAERLGPVLEKRRVEEESRLLHAALEQMTEAVVIASGEDDPVIVYVTHAFERMTGYMREEVIGRKLLQVSAPVGADAFTDAFRRALAARRPFYGELSTMRRDGTRFPCEWSVSLATRGAGVQSLIILQRDVTALNREQNHRARLAESVRKSVVEWQRTFDAIETPIWIVDLDGFVVRLNRHAQHLCGRTYSDTIGVHIAALGVGDPWSTAADLVRRVAEVRAPVTVQVCDESTRGTWDLAASVVHGSTSPGGGPEHPARVLVVARDISRLVTLQESLRQSETMATMGAIVAGVAHEVRNPLFGISATIDALELRLDDKSPYREYTEVLRSEVGRLTHLMSELLEYGRPARLDLRKGRLRPVIQQSVRACAALASSAGVTIIEDVGPKVPPIRMDNGRLVQVFTNLIENAVQHSPRGAAVTVSVTVDTHDEEIVCVVRDVGPGFRIEDVPHVFEPFFTRRRGGTGLGLSLVWRIVEEHGGNVSVEAGENQGGVVTVRLPLVNREGDSRG